jgi:hypothetical protein
MKRIVPFLAIILILNSCEKEFSTENSGNTDNEFIVGTDCRISKIIYTDTAGTSIGLPGTGLGFMEAEINNLDIVTKLTEFDSLSNTLEFILDPPIYRNDSIYINSDEYFIVDANKRITKMHGLLDPTDPFSLPFDVFYVYNASGYLVTKNYFLTSSPTTPYLRVDYTYAGANLTHMTAVNLPVGDLHMDADLTYNSLTVPKRFIYIFPDEIKYPQFTQFFNFGTRNLNTVKDMKVRNYDPGNVVRDSIVSTFSNYSMSLDTYILSVQMGGDDQPSIPALAGKLSFKYHCR